MVVAEVVPAIVTERHPLNMTSLLPSTKVVAAVTVASERAVV